MIELMDLMRTSLVNYPTFCWNYLDTEDMFVPMQKGKQPSDPTLVFTTSRYYCDILSVLLTDTVFLIP